MHFNRDHRTWVCEKGPKEKQRKQSRRRAKASHIYIYISRSNKRTEKKEIKNKRKNETETINNEEEITSRQLLSRERKKERKKIDLFVLNDCVQCD